MRHRPLKKLYQLVAALGLSDVVKLGQEQEVEVDLEDEEQEVDQGLEVRFQLS